MEDCLALAKELYRAVNAAALGILANEQIVTWKNHMLEPSPIPNKPILELLRNYLRFIDQNIRLFSQLLGCDLKREEDKCWNDIASPDSCRAACVYVTVEKLATHLCLRDCPTKQHDKYLQGRQSMGTALKKTDALLVGEYLRISIYNLRLVLNIFGFNLKNGVVVLIEAQRSWVSRTCLPSTTPAENDLLSVPSRTQSRLNAGFGAFRLEVA